MGERAILRDCLDTLKHASMCYLRASLEADSDGVRQTLARLAVDKSEAKDAVFNLMHQAGIYKTEPADPAQVEKLRAACQQFLAHPGSGPREPVARELGRGVDQAPRV
ncbi:MAG TPA: spore coat protein [Limnochordales bacterium]